MQWLVSLPRYMQYGGCMCMGLGHDHYLGLVRPLALVSFLRRGSKILIPILRWPTAIRVDIVHLFGVASLVVVRWHRSFVVLGPFSLLLELVEVQDLRFVELCEFFIQF
jgi:hypothetical protein